MIISVVISYYKMYNFLWKFFQEIVYILRNFQNFFDNRIAQVVNKDFWFKKIQREKLESNDYAVGVQSMLHVRHLETHFIERFDPESNFVICLPDQNFVS